MGSASSSIATHAPHLFLLAVPHSYASEPRVRPLLTETHLSDAQLQAVIPDTAQFSDEESLAEGCFSGGFATGSGNPVFLTEFKQYALNFYDSGAPKLGDPWFVHAILSMKRKVARMCPHAVMQAILMKIEGLLLDIYMRGSQSRDPHLLAFNEAAALHSDYSALEHWLKIQLRAEQVPDLGWPFHRGWRRVQRYYDILWQDVHDSEDTWAVMETPGSIDDDQYHQAFEEVAAVLDGLQLEWWPCRGTLIAFLRHGRRSGLLSRGIVDLVERDIDLMLGVPDESVWHATGEAIETGLKAKGWDRCWTKSSADLASTHRDAMRRDLLYCVKTKPGYMMLDVTSYVGTVPGDYVFVHRVCGDGAASLLEAGGHPVLDGSCAVPVNVGPLRHAGGVLSKASIRPLGRCKAARFSVPCPAEPLATIQAMVHSGLDAGCVALPTARGRDPEDYETQRLSSEGLIQEDVRILRERSTRLHNMGFKSMMPYFDSCRNMSGLVTM